MKILLIEDDKKIVSILEKGLKEDNFKIDIALNGEDGEYLAKINNYDIIILDWMLPDIDGVEVLKNIRKTLSTPILMLTAKDKLQDKVLGLRSGADDYLTKPFEYDELIARIEAIYRRNLSNGKNIIKIDNLEIDIVSKTIKKDNKLLKLTKKERELFFFLLKNKNNFISTSIIEDELWNEEKYINSNVISVTIHHLRQKIGKEFIKSHKGLGYKLEI